MQIDEADAASAKLLYKPMFDDVADVQYQVIAIKPLTPDAPLPPGVKAWPDPGQALLSPALLEAGRAEGVDTRFGATVGTIGEEGLSSPGEWFAYVRPPENADTSRMWPTAGFGKPTPFGVGEAMFAKPPYMLFALTAFMGALPVAALVAAAARAGSASRDQRTALLEALGGGHRVRAAVNAGEAALPVGVGALLGLAGSLWLISGDLQVPVVGYVVSGDDTQRWAGALCAAPVVAAVVVLISVLLLHPQQQNRRDSVRPRLTGQRLPRWWPYLCPFLLFLAVQGPGMATSSGTRLLVYVVGVGGTVATLPSLLGLGAVAAGHGLAAFGRRRGLSGALLAGRWTAAWPGATVRLTAGVIIAFVLVGQTQLWSTLNTGPARQAQQTVRQVGSSAVLVFLGEDRPVPAEFTAALPTGIDVLRLKSEPGKQTSEVTGTCPALKRLALPCTPQTTLVTPAHPDERVKALAGWGTPGEGLHVRQTEAPEGSTLILVGDRGHDLSVPAVKEAANRHLGISVPVETLAGSWLVAANMADLDGRWVLLYGTFAVIVIIASIMIANLAEFLRFTRKITAVSVLAGNRTIYISTAFFVLCLPLTVAAVIGLFLHHWLITPITANAYIGQYAEANGILGTVLAAATAMAVAVWLCGAWAAERAAHHWRPTAD
ncbi:hypothetical protein ACFV0H_09685 [Streptomyces erythrochromogenes]|uniref:hypothetical protein n=1 Tax=Streptomyces erythrochromogenes TaxID=285574 RepID=UPI0036927C84